MSQSRNFGVLTNGQMGQPASDLDMFAYGMIALDAAMDAGIDVTGLVTRTGSFLVLGAGLFGNAAVSARFETLFGPGNTGPAVAGGLGLSFFMPVGALVTNPDGSIAALSGGIAGQSMTGGGAGFQTTFFDAADIGAALSLAGAMPPGDLRAAADRMRAFLTRDATVGYSFIGAAVAETAETGLGTNDIATGGGDDFLRINPFGTGTLDGGPGQDALDAWVWGPGVRLFADLRAGTAGPAGNRAAYALTGIENVIGGHGDDRIFGDGLGNLLRGEDGADRISGGTGNDILIGGAGNDLCEGGPGRDRIEGADGNDTLTGGEGRDNQFGGDGNDRLEAGQGGGRQFGDRGDDTLEGGAGDDDQFGGRGNDLLNGGAGHDRQEGGLGRDSLFGGDGDDTQWGNDGKDLLEGGAGNDFQNGGSKGDTLVGGAGNDTQVGGEGADDFIFRTGTSQGNDQVADFSRSDGDRIVFYDTALTAADVTIAYDAQLRVSTVTYVAEDDTTGTIVLPNVQITPADLVFVPP